MHPRVLIAREASRAAELIEALRVEKITAIAEPVPTIERIADAASLPDLSRVDWVAFTSRNGAEIFLKILHESGRVLPPDVRLAAVGPATAQIIRQRLRPLNIVTGGTGSAKLAEALLDDCHGSTGFTVLWPCARDAQRDFVNILETAGVKVIEWPVYATEFIPPWLLRSRLEHPSSFDVVVFAAPSAVKSLKETWPEAWTFTSVAIGETTAEMLNKYAMTRFVTSRSPRTADLVAAIKQALNDRESTTLTFTPKERS